MKTRIRNVFFENHVAVVSNVVFSFCLLTLFIHFSYPPPPLCTYKLVFLLLFKDSTYKIDHAICLSDWIISLSIMLLRSIQVVANSKNSFFIWLNNIPLYIRVEIYTTFPLPIKYQWTFKLFPCLGHGKTLQ